MELKRYPMEIIIFWLAYEIAGSPTINEQVDATFTSVTVGSPQTPAVTTLPGSRTITNPFYPIYDPSPGTTMYGDYITNITFAGINNTSRR